VRAPTLLLVGGEDHEVLALNRRALAEIGRHAQLIVIPGATHLFEEPGTLEAVAEHAAGWLARRMPARNGSRPDGDDG
jgi:pimeloyl-ACP methyl ester carboxylesterase